jgi:hypothetical protein
VRAIAIAVVLLTGGGCYTGKATALASDERRFRTGLEPGDGIALWVAGAERCRTSDPVSEGECEPRPVAEVEEKLRECLALELDGAPVQMIGDALGSPPASGEPEALLRWLAADELRARAAEMKLRYVIALRARTSEGGFPSGGNTGIGWVIARAEERTTRLRADVIDSARARVPGSISAKAYGPSGNGVLFVLALFPVPLIQDAQTEPEACKAAAKQIAEFLKDPEPRKWLPEP